MTLLKEGDFAPDFSLPDQDGNIHTLSGYRDKWVLLYFYPRDNTPGCTKEACTIRDVHETFRSRGLEVFGVSTDPISRHKKFVEKHNLPFTLLSDEKKEVVQKYGVWGEKRFMGKVFSGTRRMSFLIAPDGHIAKIYNSVKPSAHAQEVLIDQEKLS